MLIICVLLVISVSAYSENMHSPDELGVQGRKVHVTGINGCQQVLLL